MSDTITPAPSLGECRAAVISLNYGGIGTFDAVRILLAHAELAHDDEDVLAAMKIRKALALLDDPFL